MRRPPSCAACSGSNGCACCRCASCCGPARRRATRSIDGSLAPPRDDPWVRVGAVKLIADGSIQGYTGYLSEPYFVPPGDDPTFRGYPRIPRDKLIAWVDRIHRAGLQVAIHGNGDAAIDDILDALEAAQRADAAPRRAAGDHPRADGARGPARSDGRARRDPELLRAAHLLLGRSAPRSVPRPGTRRAHQSHRQRRAARDPVHAARRHAGRADVSRCGSCGPR